MQNSEIAQTVEIAREILNAMQMDEGDFEGTSDLDGYQVMAEVREGLYEDLEDGFDQTTADTLAAIERAMIAWDN